MQGFFINTRKDIFKNRIVRKALNYAFDFEWTNKILFFNQYKRTVRDCDRLINDICNLDC